MNKREVIALCVRRCARSRDGRGPWQAENSCRMALVRLGTPYLVAYDTAEAAHRVGVSIRDAAARLVRR